MKTFMTLIALSVLGASANSFAQSEIQCSLKTMKVTVSYDRDSNEFSATFKKGSGRAQVSHNVQETRITRSQVERDEYLASLLEVAGLEINNILAARAYITDSNNEGEAGLMVFTAGRGEIVGKVFFASYSGYAEACRIDP